MLPTSLLHIPRVEVRYLAARPVAASSAPATILLTGGTPKVL